MADDDELSVRALGEAFTAFVEAAAARNPHRSWSEADRYDEAALEAAEQQAAETLDEILARRKARRDP